jgi:hypothetical protein
VVGADCAAFIPCSSLCNGDNFAVRSLLFLESTITAPSAVAPLIPIKVTADSVKALVSSKTSHKNTNPPKTRIVQNAICARAKLYVRICPGAITPLLSRKMLLRLASHINPNNALHADRLVLSVIWPSGCRKQKN